MHLFHNTDGEAVYIYGKKGIETLWAKQLLPREKEKNAML